MSKKLRRIFECGKWLAKILEIRGDTEPLSERWVAKFLTRHSQVKRIMGKRLDRSRIEASTQKATGRFYTLFESSQCEFQIAQENVWNMDEHGLAQGICANQCVIGESKKNFTYKQASHN